MSEEMKTPAQKIWQHQPVEGIKMSAEVIRKRAGKFERTIWGRNLLEYVASLIAAALLGHVLITTHDALSRITFGLFIAAMAWIVLQLHRKGSAKRIPTGVDTVTSLRLYRAELERQRQVVTNVWSWYLAPLVPGLVVYTVGYAIKFPRPAAWAGLALLDAIVAAMFFGIWKMNMRAARCLQRMIDELQGAENSR